MRPKITLLAIALVAALAAVAPPASALSNEQMALDIINNRASQAESDICLSTPACKALVIGTKEAEGSGTSQTEASVLAEDTSGESAKLSKLGCQKGKPHTLARYYDRHNDFGQIVYRWHVVVYTCVKYSDPHKVLAYRGVNDYVTKAMWFVDVTSDKWTDKEPLPTQTARVWRQRHIQLVMFTKLVPVNVYPNAELYTFSDGGPDFDRGTAG